MPLGWTGYVFERKAYIGFFNTLSIYDLETFETHEKVSSGWHKKGKIKFDTKFAMLRAYIKINKAGKR